MKEKTKVSDEMTVTVFRNDGTIKSQEVVTDKKTTTLQEVNRKIIEGMTCKKG